MDREEEKREIELDDRIDAFLKGMMSKEEEAAFKEEVAQNADMQQLAQEKLLLLKGVKAYGMEQDHQIVLQTRSQAVQNHDIQKHSINPSPYLPPVSNHQKLYVILIVIAVLYILFMLIINLL